MLCDRRSDGCSEFCVPETSGNPCYVVHGATTILLDQRSGDIQQSALDAIAIGLENVGRVQSFDPNVIRAQFERPLGESLTSNSWSDQRNTTLSVPATATIAVAAASVSIVLVSFFWYGLVRRELRQHPDPNRRHPVRRPPSRPMRVIRGMSLGPPRKQRPFSRLDDVSHCPSGMISTDSSEERLEIQGPIQRHEPSPSIIWSVSDVTCDSGSFRSFVSITTSRLERIDEEEGDEDVDRTDEDRLLYELVERPRRNILGNEPPSGLIDRSDRMDQVLSMHSIQISSLEDDDLEQELEGCRFIPDEPCSAPTRGSLLSHRLKSALPGAEDLDISLEMLDDVKSIFSALSTSDDDDDDDSDDMVELRNSDIQDECRIQPLAGVSFGASLRDRDNHCQLDLMESTSFGRFGVEQAFTQMALSNSLSSQPAPDGTRPGGYLPTATMVTPVRNWKQEEGTQERLTENPSLTQGNSKLSYPAFQCQPEDRTIMVGPADDSLEGSIACSVPAPATADCAESVC